MLSKPEAILLIRPSKMEAKKNLEVQSMYFFSHAVLYLRALCTNAQSQKLSGYGQTKLNDYKAYKKFCQDDIINL